MNYLKASYESLADLSVFKFLFPQILVSAQKCQPILFNSKCKEYAIRRVNILPEKKSPCVYLHACLTRLSLLSSLPCPRPSPPSSGRGEASLQLERHPGSVLYGVTQPTLSPSNFSYGLVFPEHHTG